MASLTARLDRSGRVLANRRVAALCTGLQAWVSVEEG